MLFAILNNNFIYCS